MRRGYTLIELIVVLIIAGIISSALAFSGRALLMRQNDADARVRLTSVLLTEQRLLSTAGRYSAWPSDLGQLPRGMTVTSSASSLTTSVSAAVGSQAGALALSVLSASGSCVSVVTGAPPSATLTWTTSTGVCDARALLPTTDPAALPASVRP